MKKNILIVALSFLSLFNLYHNLNHSCDGLNKIAPKITIGYKNISETYDISERNVSLSFPVATIRPRTNNKVLALDLMPNGNPDNFKDNGVVWFDIINTDIKKNPKTDLTLLRMGIDSDGNATFGVKGLNGGRGGDLRFIYGEGAKPKTAGYLNSIGNLEWVNSIYAKDFNLLNLQTPPAYSGDSGQVGEIRFAENYIYVCTDTNKWKRVNILDF